MNPIACWIDNIKVNLNQFELNFSDQDVLRNDSLKLATIIISFLNNCKMKSNFKLRFKEL